MTCNLLPVSLDDVCLSQFNQQIQVVGQFWHRKCCFWISYCKTTIIWQKHFMECISVPREHLNLFTLVSLPLTLTNARWFYSSMEIPTGVKGLKLIGPVHDHDCLAGLTSIIIICYYNNHHFGIYFENRIFFLIVLKCWHYFDNVWTHDGLCKKKMGPVC